ncbi:MAG TPA: hypothetical protein VGG45_16150 [Terracidiphilus sp.]|jgi:hypothetical protein
MSDYQPKIDDIITVELPDERTRGKIVKVVSPQMVIAQLEHFTTGSKSHPYKKGDFIPCRYQVGQPMNLKGWYAVPQSELDAAEEAPEPEPDAPVREATAEDIFGKAEHAAA